MTSPDYYHIQYFSPAQLQPRARNPRVHSKKQIRQIAESIKKFGFTNPILIDETKGILAGHGRWQAAKLIALDRIPCLTVSQMTPQQKRAYVIADNKLAANAGWDNEILATELSELIQIDPSFDISITGFEIAEVDNLIESLNPEEKSDPRADTVPAVGAQAISKPGDLWLLGDHKVYCGSATDPVAFESLMKGDVARMVFTDPPYNVPIKRNVSGLGKNEHREFAMGSGEMSSDQFKEFLSSAFDLLIKHSIDGSIHYICMDWRHIPELQAAAKNYTQLKNLCIWVKSNGGMGTFYRSRHELIFAYKNGTAPHLNSFELGQHGRNRSNVWQYAGMNAFSSTRDSELSLHPTVKPVELIVDAIKDVSCRGDIVLDCFGGSGSTVIAAHKAGRRARLIELDPLYVDVIVRRWQLFAKDDATLADGSTFDEIMKHGRGFTNVW